MNLAILAHDSKKELMVQFCIAYRGILSRHNICATATTGNLVSEATGLKIEKYLSGTQGGDQQIAARIKCNEIDLLLFFRDHLTTDGAAQNVSNTPHDLLRACDQNNIPVATNIATAEMLIHGIERGDLDWRNIIKTRRN
ncbi:MAG: methylglyoxal synthase [Oscillospiraceae bacterium]|nr:methylglyoxal synthase [Oscillospiraceae bacterium]